MGLLATGAVVGGITLASLWADWRNKKLSDKAMRRVQKLDARYGGVTLDEFKKWGRSKQHKFAADLDRAASAGGIGSFGSSKRKILKNVERKLTVQKQSNTLQKLPNLTERGQKIYDKELARASKRLDRKGLYQSTPGKQAQADAKAAAKLDPKFAAVEKAAGLAGTKVDTGALPEYGKDIAKNLWKQMEQDITKNYLENILPDIKSAFAGDIESGAYGDAVVRSKSELDKALLAKQAEIDAYGAELGLRYGDQELSRRALNRQTVETGLGASRYLEDTRGTRLDRNLTTRQTDESNTISQLRYLLGLSPHTYHAPGGGGFSFNPSPNIPQQTNYTGQIAGPAIQEVSRQAGKQIANSVF